MKIKTQDLIGAQLDWAVAKCEGWECEFSDEVSGPWLIPADGYLNDERPLSGFTPSTKWAQSGPIIEQEKISTCWEGTTWVATLFNKNCGETWYGHHYGPTSLIAAMRCFVALKLGNEVEVPEGLQP